MASVVTRPRNDCYVLRGTLNLYTLASVAKASLSYIDAAAV